MAGSEVTDEVSRQTYGVSGEVGSGDYASGLQGRSRRGLTEGRTPDFEPGSHRRWLLDAKW